MHCNPPLWDNEGHGGLVLRSRGRTGIVIILLLASLLLTSMGPMAQPGGVPPTSSRQSTGGVPDLVVSNISLAVEGPMDGASIGVFAKVDNNGTGAARNFYIAVFVAGSQVSMTLVADLAAGNSTTIEGMTKVTAGYLEIKAIADFMGVVPELSKANNILVRTVWVPPPDLTVTDLSFIPANFSDGDKVTATATIRNLGADTIAPFSCSLFLDEAVLRMKSFTSLRAGDSVVMVGDWTAAAGQHDLIARADTENTLRETNESNNRRILPLTGGYPELRIENLTIKPTKFVDGDTVVINARIRNAGQVTHSTFRARLLVDGIEKDTEDINGLIKNGTRDMAFLWTALGGKHELRVDVDPDSLVAEANEGNNFMLLAQDIKLPDLSVESLDLSPAIPADGSLVTASVLLRNRGTGATNQTIAVQFTDNGEILGETFLQKGLAVNATARVNRSITVQSGKNFLSVLLNRGGSIPEANISNNAAMKVLDVLFPDIYLTNLTVTPNATSLVDGGTGTIKVTVRNRGPGNTTSTFKVDLFLDGKRLGSIQVQGLLTSTSKVLTTDFKAVGGRHFVSAKADPEDIVPEADETNNIAIMDLAVGLPEIQIVDLFWTPSSPAIGQTVTLTAVLKNIGKPTLRDIFVDFLANRTPVAYATVHGPSLVGNVNVRADYKVIGNEMTMEAAADRTMQVPDANRTNNMVSRSFPSGSLVTLPRGPDLIISNLTWLPARPVDGEEVSFIATLKNTGGIPDPGPDGSNALRPVVTLLVDNERITDSSITMLSSEGVVVVPWTAGAGSHRIAAVVDWAMTIDEGNETNNVAETGMTIGRADLALSDLKIVSEGAEDGNTVPIFVKVTNPANRTVRDVRLQYYIDGIMSGYETVEGASMNGTISVLHNWMASPGSHSVIVLVDPDRDIKETNEKNNFVSGSVFVRVPDLSVVSLQAQAMVDDGSEATITARIRNVGQGGTLRAFNVNIFIDGFMLGSKSIGGLPAGEERVISTTVAPGPGKHFIRAVVDPDGSVAELTMSNNAMTRPGLNVSYSDISVRSVTFGPSEGRTVFVQVTVTNKGNTTTRSVPVAFLIDGDRVLTETLDGLAGGHNTTLVEQLDLGQGSKRLKIVVDPLGTLSESDESNNQLVVNTPYRAFPNLYVDELDVGGPLVLGGELRITAKVRALGATVYSPFFVAFYIDGSLLGTTRVGGITKGEVAYVDILAGADIGRHHLRVQVDPDGSVSEKNEMDNAAVTTYTVTPPDLQIMEVRSYTSPDGTTVFARVKNNGSHLLLKFNVAFYADGKLMGKAQVQALSSLTSTQVMMVVPAGSGTVRVVADEEGAIPEKDESNNGMNAKLLPDSVDGALDLAVSDIYWVPQVPADGETVTVFVVMDNAGNRTFLDTATVQLLVNGVSAAQGAVGGIPDGGTAMVPFKWTVTAGSDINFTARVTPVGKGNDSVPSNDQHSVYMNVTSPALKVLNVTDSVGYFGEERTMFLKIGNTGGDTFRHFVATVTIEGTLVSSEVITSLPSGANMTLAMPIKRSWGEKELLVGVGPESGGTVAGGPDSKLSNVSLGWPDLSVTDLWYEKGANASMTTAFAQVRNRGFDIGTLFSIRMFVNGKDSGPRSAGGLQHNGSIVLAWSFMSTDIELLAAFADDTNAIPESNELNNYLEENYTGNESYFPPDINLALTSLNITQYGEPLNGYFLDALIENQGNNVSGFKVKFLVDGKSLTEVPVDPMKANTSRTITVQYFGRAEAHIFKVIVDSTRAIAELDETDNELRIPHPANFAPIPYPGNDQTITQGGKAKLFARGWDAEPGRIVRYEWDFDGDGRYEWSSNQSQTVWHTYKNLPKNKATYYNATLRVTDDQGAMSTATVKIKVVEKRPWPDIPPPDRTRIASFILGMVFIMSGLVILYLFMRASRPMKVTKAELERRKRQEKEGTKRVWPPWKQEPKDELEDEREAEPDVEQEPTDVKPAAYPEYPEESPEGPPAEIQDLPEPPEEKET